MEKEFVPYEQALALKELGFDEPCFGYWSNWAVQEPFLLTCELGKEIESASINRKNILFKAPTFSQAFRFFREKHQLSGTPQYFTGGYYCYTINDMKDTKESNRLFTEFKTHEEAELACLKKLIEIVNSHKLPDLTWKDASKEEIKSKELKSMKGKRL